MHDSVLVGMIHAAQYVAAPRQGLLFRNPSSAVYQISETAPRKVLFHHQAESILFHIVDHRGEVRVTQFLHDGRGLPKTSDELRIGRELFLQLFYDHLVSVFGVVGKIHDGHAALTYLIQDDITIGVVAVLHSPSTVSLPGNPAQLSRVYSRWLNWITGQAQPRCRPSLRQFRLAQSPLPHKRQTLLGSPFEIQSWEHRRFLVRFEPDWRFGLSIRAG